MLATSLEHPGKAAGGTWSARTRLLAKEACLPMWTFLQPVPMAAVPQLKELPLSPDHGSAVQSIPWRKSRHPSPGGRGWWKEELVGGLGT